MKNFALSISLLSLSVLPLSVFSVNISEVNDVFTSVEFIKESIDFENVTIDSKVPYNLVQGAIQKYCPAPAIDQAVLELEQFKNIGVYDTNKSNVKKLLSSRFDAIKGLILNKKKDDQYKYCKDTYLLFSALKDTQDLYVGNAQETENTNNHKASKTSEKSNLQQDEPQYKKLNFNFVHNTDGLPKNVKQSYSKSTDNYLQEVLSSLVDSNILNESDLKILNNKIEVTYKQSCDFTEGAFRIVKTIETEEYYTFKDISLIIAYCGENDSPERQKRHVQQILAHELGHYIYFFKDANHSKFGKICRDDNKNICQSEDFVSDYSKESPEEDYADSFAYRYLYNRSGNGDTQPKLLGNPIQKRFSYFEISFGKKKPA